MVSEGSQNNGHPRWFSSNRNPSVTSYRDGRGHTVSCVMPAVTSDGAENQIKFPPRRMTRIFNTIKRRILGAFSAISVSGGVGTFPHGMATYGVSDSTIVRFSSHWNKQSWMMAKFGCGNCEFLKVESCSVRRITPGGCWVFLLAEHGE
jgi:hypothetical protein